MRNIGNRGAAVGYSVNTDYLYSILYYLYFWVTFKKKTVNKREQKKKVNKTIKYSVFSFY